MPDMLVFSDNSLDGRYGQYSALLARATPDGRYAYPVRVLDDPEFAGIRDKLVAGSREAVEWPELPPDEDAAA